MCDVRVAHMFAQCNLYRVCRRDPKRHQPQLDLKGAPATQGRVPTSNEMRIDGCKMTLNLTELIQEQTVCKSKLRHLRCRAGQHWTTIPHRKEFDHLAPENQLDIELF